MRKLALNQHGGAMPGYQADGLPIKASRSLLGSTKGSITVSCVILASAATIAYLENFQKIYASQAAI
jgi:hypothetical protein